MNTFINKLKTHKDFKFVSKGGTSSPTQSEETVSFKYDNRDGIYILHKNTNKRTRGSAYGLTYKNMGHWYDIPASYYVREPKLSQIIRDIDTDYIKIS